MSVDFTVVDGVAEVVLNRPEAMNSIDPEMRKELLGTWGRIAQDDDIYVAIITGAGDRAFCTGSDLKKTMPPSESYAELNFGSASPTHLLAGMDKTDKPMICAINGYAVGGGLELALACDLRIASSSATFGLSEVRMGSIPGAGGTQRLPRAVGSAVAMQMLLVGDRIDAIEAHRIGLVSEVMQRPELMPRAHELATKIRDNAPLAVRAVKRLVRDGLQMPLDSALQMENYVFGLLRDTEDRIEGRTAFKEKRQPVYRGA